MPRQPTGRPPGRPVGSGAVLEREQIRLTVRIPATLYDRMEAFAEGLHFTRGTPQLSGCVREALEHFLTCPHIRQTQTVHTSHSANNGQTTTVQTAAMYINGQTQTMHTVSSCDNGQTENSTAPVLPLSVGAEDIIRQTENSTALEVLPAENTGEDARQSHHAPAVVPAYDSVRFILGTLCSRGHDWQGTGQSLRELRQGKVADCTECHRERSRATAEAKRLAKQGAGQ
jgi:hypothetical protein